MSLLMRMFHCSTRLSRKSEPGELEPPAAAAAGLQCPLLRPHVGHAGDGGHEPLPETAKRVLIPRGLNDKKAQSLVNYSRETLVEVTYFAVPPWNL